MPVATQAWRCTVCGYVHRGAEPPLQCPVCGALRELFEPWNEPASEEHPTLSQGERGATAGGAPRGDRRAGIAGVAAAESLRTRLAGGRDHPGLQGSRASLLPAQPDAVSGRPDRPAGLADPPGKLVPSAKDPAAAGHRGGGPRSARARGRVAAAARSCRSTSSSWRPGPSRLSRRWPEPNWPA